MRPGMTCNRFILEEQRHHPQATGELSEILTQIVLAAKVVSREVNKAGLIEILGKTGTKNVQGEEVQKLDVYANDQFVNAPLHADQRVFDNSTERSDNHLKLGGGAQPSKPKWEKRGNRSVPREKFEY